MPCLCALAQAELAQEAAAGDVRRADAADGVRCWREHSVRSGCSTAVRGPSCRIALSQVRPHVQSDCDARPVSPEALHRLLQAPAARAACFVQHIPQVVSVGG